MRPLGERTQPIKTLHVQMESRALTRNGESPNLENSNEQTKNLTNGRLREEEAECLNELQKLRIVVHGRDGPEAVGEVRKRRGAVGGEATGKKRAPIKSRRLHRVWISPGRQSA